MSKRVSWMRQGNVAGVFAQKGLVGEQLIEAVKEPAAWNGNRLTVWQPIHNGFEECIGIWLQTKELPVVRKHTLPGWEVVLEDRSV